MCHSRIFILIFLIPIFLFGQNKAYTPEQIGQVIQKVGQDNKQALDQLMAISLGDHPITMTQDIIKVVVYGLIRSNQKEKLNDYLKKVDSGMTGFLNDKKVNKGCNSCDGKGNTEVKCPKCVFGKCYNCKGVGYIEYKGIKGASKSKEKDQKEKSICNVCHATGKCLRCKGAGKLEQNCAHCREGQVLDKRSITQQMIKAIQNISKQTKSVVSTKTVNDTKTSQELDSLFNQTVKKSVEQDDGNDQINPAEETGIQKAFKKAKAYIEDYELKTNKDICKDISLKYMDKVPALVLDMSDGYVQKIDTSKVREMAGFKKYWEDQAIIHGYDKEVATLLMHNGVKINDKFTLSEKFKRVK